MTQRSGGLKSGDTAPASFPKLRRGGLEMGADGNRSLTIQGFLAGMLRRSASARNGLRQNGLERHVHPVATPMVRFGQQRYAVATVCGASATTLPGMLSGAVANDFVSYSAAQLAIEQQLATHPHECGRYMVLRKSELAA